MPGKKDIEVIEKKGQFVVCDKVHTCKEESNRSCPHKNMHRQANDCSNIQDREIDGGCFSHKGYCRPATKEQLVKEVVRLRCILKEIRLKSHA